MKRVSISPRKNWIEKVEELGFTFHSLDDLYWDESVAYEFSMQEILDLEKATNELHALCLDAVQKIIDNKWFNRFGLSDDVADLIMQSWDEDHPAIYGRFDLAYNAALPPGQRIKMLEYNADTPTSLFEAAVVQWYWLQEFNSNYDQFNSIHERLIDYWKYLIPYLKSPGVVHFACLNENIEDLTTTEYMRDTATQAGLETELIYVEHIGYESEERSYFDMDEEVISNLFKLYPWEWMIKEEFAEGLFHNPLAPYFIEPAWKMLLSHKMILSILWELNPGHPLLLPAYDSPDYFRSHQMDYIGKPVLGREGNNISVCKNGLEQVETDGVYQDTQKIYQGLFALPDMNGCFPVLGSWVIGGEAAGMGIRESTTIITGNTSRFIPHYIKD
ncbi:MAG: glutathionylspermidine synthase family protein [Ignavibacteria bacterium]|nr:glutathionylspermidine synthase family protein [Ignavibacteria bacterium]